MANQYCLTEIPDDERQHVVELYKTGIGIDTIVKRGLSPYGHVVTARIIRESKIPRMPRGNQIKYQPQCPNNKVCSCCGDEKSKERFSPYKTATDGLRGQCKECRVETERRNQLKRNYGITQQVYEEMYTQQRGLCACCGQPETSRRRKDRGSLSIDHDHRTGKVRQLLCHRCNVTLGLVKENSDLCELLRQYILTHCSKEEG
jgi:hypothetical protein